MRFSVSAAAVAVGLVAFASPRPAQAVLGVGDICANCATEVTAILQQAELVRNAATQLRMEITQAQQYTNMLLNTASLPQYLWNDVQGSINEVRGLSRLPDMFHNQGGFSLSSLPSYGSALQMPLLRWDTWQNRYTYWNRRANTASASLLSAFGGQEERMADDEAALNAARIQIETAEGQKQAQQAIGAAIVQNAAEARKTRQVLLIQGQQIANAEAMRADKEATAIAAHTQMMMVPDAAVEGNPRYSAAQ